MELTGQGLILMAVGLSVVFIFLVTLILVMMASSKVFMRYAHLMPEEAQSHAKPKAGADETGPVIAAIAAIAARLLGGKG